MRRRLSGKKPPILAFGTIAVSSVVLSGCGREPPQGPVFTSVAQCISLGKSQPLCQAAYDDAMRAHAANAPRFKDNRTCEEEYGTGNCTEPQGGSGGGSGGTYIGGGNRRNAPAFVGYTFPGDIRNLDDYSRYRNSLDAGRPYYGATPIYRSRSGEMVTTTVGGGYGADLSPSKPSSRPVNISSHTSSRHGFGSGRGFGFGG